MAEYKSKHTGAAIDAGIDRANAALPASGGTMTGPLVLSGDPTADLGAATRQYVDAAVENIALTPGANGTTFTPSVSSEGVLTWTNDGGLANPAQVSILGPRGGDGVSPSVTVTDIDGGHRVTITDAEGETSFDVMDGAGGGSGGVSSWNDLTDKPFDVEYTDAYVLSESTHTTDGTVNISSPLENKIVAGKTYSVSWNGTVYDLVAGNFLLDGVTMIGLGNFGVLIEGESTGEPFAFVQIPDDLVLALGAYAMIMPLDGSTAFTISIYGPTVTYRTIDPNYLPPSDNCNLVNGTGMYSIKSTAATAAAGTGSCAFGIGTSAAHDGGHAEGYRSQANGDYSHAEGENTVAAGRSTHAEGWRTEANASFSHAEGNFCKTGIYGEASHAEGYSTEASASAAHAEGYVTKARGTYSHAEGYYTLASGYAQHAQGKFNIEDMNGKYLHIVGNGESNSARSNAHTLDTKGVAWFKGRPQFGGTAQDDGAQTLMANGDGQIILSSPNGTQFAITVSDDGVLSAAAVTA